MKIQAPASASLFLAEVRHNTTYLYSESLSGILPNKWNRQNWYLTANIEQMHFRILRAKSKIRLGE